MNTWVSAMPRKALFTGLAECVWGGVFECVCVCVCVCVCIRMWGAGNGGGG